MGCLAQTGVECIASGHSQLKKSTTFEQMRELDEDMYEQTIQFMYPLAVAGVYYP